MQLRLCHRSQGSLANRQVAATRSGRFICYKQRSHRSPGSHLRFDTSINTHKAKGTSLWEAPFTLVPVTGVEPVQCFHRRILSPLRLPVPPHRRFFAYILYLFTPDLSTETLSGFRLNRFLHRFVPLFPIPPRILPRVLRRFCPRLCPVCPACAVPTALRTRRCRWV